MFDYVDDCFLPDRDSRVFYFSCELRFRVFGGFTVLFGIFTATFVEWNIMSSVVADRKVRWLLLCYKFPIKC